MFSIKRLSQLQFIRYYSSQSETIGFIGLGNMGLSMARNLMKQGFPLVVFDVNSGSMSKLESEGASLASSPKEVAEYARKIISMVPASAHVKDVYCGTKGVLQAARKGDVYIDVTESDLYELFKQAGSVQSIRVCRDSATRQSLGYAYVNFNSSADAERGLDTLNYTPLKGKPIRISWSQRDPSLRRSNIGNTFIKNLEKDIDALALEEIFGQFGNIVSCKVQTDSEGNSLGFGFVHFEKEAASKSAIEKI